MTNKTNNVLRAVYTYCFQDDLKNLKLETDKGVGFEAWPFDSIFNISEENRRKLIPGILKEPTLGILRKIQINLSGEK